MREITDSKGRKIITMSDTPPAQPKDGKPMITTGNIEKFRRRREEDEAARAAEEEQHEDQE